MRIGVDTGGTFTDFVRVDRDGLTTHKVRSTPGDPSRAILEGLRALGALESGDIVHGSTVATNAVLERRGAKVALVATAGFEDVIHIGRQTRPELYNIFVKPRAPLVDRSLVFGIRERLDAAGLVVTPIDAAQLSRLVVNVQASGAEIVAVCLLHSYANPVHENAVAKALRAAGITVCTSFEILPEYREFERWSTTVVNAYVTPLMDRYLARLEAFLGNASSVGTDASLGHAVRLSVMQSNGGSISAGAARAQAVRTVLSGPAAGVVGAKAVAAAAGFTNVISFDMGGTSTDVSLIDGRIRTTTDGRVGEFPVRVPMIDIHTVGAGGGSIASIDSGGALKVGPESAGAEPGPACYGAGTRMTVTDANLMLGRLDAKNFFGGKMTLDVARAKAAAEPLARILKVSATQLAAGVIRVANANMERAIRVVSVERGHDPRDFALLAFGGAGGMHACEIADVLDMKTVIIPRQAGVLSALGMLMADVTKDYTASVLMRASDLAPSDLAGRYAPLVAAGQRDLAKEGLTGSKAVCAKWIDVRYAGQSYEISLPFTARYAAEFHRLHGKTYGYSNPRRPVEVVNIRVVASGKAEKPKLRGNRKQATRSEKGPKVITGPEATAFVPAGWKWRTDALGNLICTR
jgi:N-methylhydantoinase A/oxoprolinase/acetone carboxylase beta subunit